jgi:dihydropteroate synthase
MKTIQIGPATFEWGRQTYVMGIINVTPDSFSGDGVMREADWIKRAIEQGIQFVQAGAHLLDVGGESTRPGAAPVDAGEERQRVLPVIKALAAEVNVPISIDTYKADVADAVRRTKCPGGDYA